MLADYRLGVMLALAGQAVVQRAGAQKLPDDTSVTDMVFTAQNQFGGVSEIIVRDNII